MVINKNDGIIKERHEKKNRNMCVNERKWNENSVQEQSFYELQEEEKRIKTDRKM